MCSATSTGTGRSAGSAGMRRASACGPPVEVPITTTPACPPAATTSRTGALAGKQVGGRWRIEEDSLEAAGQVRQEQEDLAEEGYLDPAEIAETTREAREEAEEDAEVPTGDDDRGETIDRRELKRD